MRLGNADQPIQALAPNRADDSFADRIGFRTTRRRLQHLDAKSAHRFVEMRGDVAVNQATSAVLDDDEYIEQPERGGHDDHKITGYDSLGVQTQECRPP